MLYLVGCPQVELKSLPHKNQICGSSVSVHKLKINVLLLKIEILEKNPERSPKIGGIYFLERAKQTTPQASQLGAMAPAFFTFRAAGDMNQVGDTHDESEHQICSWAA